MAKKATLTPVTDTALNAGAINTQLNAINDQLDNTLSLDGSTPNAMNADVDLNSNDILNAANIYAADIIVAGSSVSASATASAASAAASAVSATASSTSATAASLSATQAAQYDGIWLDDVTALLADTTLTYTAGQPSTVVVGDYVRTRKEGFAYQVAAVGDVTTAGGIQLDVMIESDGFFPFGAMGADDTGATDVTAKVNTALASHKVLKFPAGTFLVSDIGAIASMHVKGAGEGEASRTTLLVGTNNAGAFLANTTASDITGVKIENVVCYPAPGVTGARFIRQTSKTNYLAYPHFNGIETHQSLEKSYDIWPIFMVYEHSRDGFRNTNNPGGGQTHQVMEAIPATYGQFKQSNLNYISNCKFFRSTNLTGGFDIQFGVNWKFNSCDWEDFTGRALNIEGIHNVTFDSPWFEDVDATEVIRATISTAPVAQGSRPTVIRNGHCNMNANNTHFIVLGSASTASIDNMTFANVPSGTVLSTNNTRMKSILGTQVLSGAGSADFIPTQGSVLGNVTVDTTEIAIANAAKLVVAGRYEPFQLLKTGLTDGPGSPETVATFTMPAVTLVTGQVLDSAIVDMDAVVTSVATTTTVTGANRQRLRVFMIMQKDGTVAANIATSDLVSLTNGAGNTVTWSVSVSGADVILKMTSNPSGGSFAGGIRATLVGEIRSTGSESSFAMPTYA